MQAGKLFLLRDITQWEASENLRHKSARHEKNYFKKGSQIIEE
jgi:hypothetical protein